MNFCSNNVVALHKQSRALAGVAITYARGDSSIELTAVPSGSEIEVETGDIITRSRTLDYLVLASELVIDDTPILPARGDVITDEHGTRLPLSIAGDARWRWNDPTRKVIRIHVKEV